MIGADGIHSTVRAQLFPDEGPPLWNGVMTWRGAVDWPRFLTGRSMIIAGGMDAKLVVYPIADGVRSGTRLTNWVVCVKTSGDRSAPPPRQDWSRPAQQSELLGHARLFSSPHVDITGLVAGTASSFELPMCDRDPLPFWTSGRVSLLGDAAHPMYPVGSNGAGQAILDASSLAQHLQREPDVSAALVAYQDERLPATAEVIRLNRAGGPEGVIDEVERRAPGGFERLEDVISHLELERIVASYARAAGFTTEQVNS
jgi:2-polyprenyl-6-methoxyphenol hydroxylase-like FAD-dependent oxidoreductase